MRRWTVRIFVFLVLGAIINVAVAWGCAFWSSSSGVSPLSYGVEASAAWHAWALPHWSEPPAYELISDVASIGTSGGIVGGVSTLDPVVDLETTVMWTSFGLPCRSMVCVAWAEENRLVKASRMVLYGRSYPRRPIWPGFAINTVFYAAIVWLLFAGPFVLRRRRRIRRGLCPKCAYDLRGTPAGATACPECGAKLLRRTVVAVESNGTRVATRE